MENIVDIKYEYHDSTVEKIEIKGEILIIYIDLYPIFYKNEPKIKLCFNEITNIEKCKEFVNKLMEKYNGEDNYLGARIDRINVLKEENSLYKCFINCDDITLKFKCKFIMENEI